MKKSCSSILENSSLFDREYENFEDYLENGLFKSPHIPIDFKALVNVITVGDFIKHKFDSYLEQHFDLSIPQKNILESLVFSKKKSMTQKELSAFVFTSKGNLSSLLERMEKKELIQRIINDKNKREKQVKVTSKGKELIFKVQHHFEEAKQQESFLDDVKAQKLHGILSELKPKFEHFFSSK